MSRPGVAVAYRWELRKLAAQKRTYLGLGAMVALPLAFTVGVAADGGDMEGALFSQVVDSGLATTHASARAASARRRPPVRVVSPSPSGPSAMERLLPTFNVGERAPLTTFNAPASAP